MTSFGTQLLKSGVPQSRQKPRSILTELLKIASSPRVHSRSAFLTVKVAKNGAPNAFWHMRQ